MIPNLPPLPNVVPQQLESGFVPDTGDERPVATALPDTQSLGFSTLVDALNAGGGALEKAEAAENAFVAGTGGLQEMVFERAKADSIVSVAAAASSRVAQSLNTFTQMQL
jgi:hypothetical protein